MNELHDELIAMPVHITGFFKPHYSDNPAYTGSIGAGLLLSPGITFRFSLGNGGLKLNGGKCEVKPANHLSTKLKKTFVEVFTSLKPGVGYAISAATTLAVALSYAWLFNIPEKRMALMAHISEVEHRTGLGDVISIFEGSGLVIREKAGGPGIGKTRSYNLPINTSVITVDIGTMSTETMLSTLSSHLETYGQKALRIFENQPSLEGFLETSRWFSEKVGFLTPDINEKLRTIKNMIIGFYVKKKVLVIVPETQFIEEVMEYLETEFGKARIFKMGDNSWRKSLKVIPGIIH